jgi:hypothetical protein
VLLYVTVGSPLAIGAVRHALKNFARLRCPQCAAVWFNALDERDVVALYPLDTSFPLNHQHPAIENKTTVDNHTDGIAGYLNDPDVARRIYNALTANCPP